MWARETEKVDVQREKRTRQTVREKQRLKG